MKIAFLKQNHRPRFLTKEDALLAQSGDYSKMILPFIEKDKQVFVNKDWVDARYEQRVIAYVIDEEANPPVNFSFEP